MPPRLLTTPLSLQAVQRWRLCGFLIGPLLALFFCTASPVAGATITVTNTNDSGPGSLRQLIADAPPGDTITFDASLNGQTIVLSDTLTIDKDLTIDGNILPEAITLSGNNHIRVMTITSGTTASLIGFIIADGKTFALSPPPPVYNRPEAGAGLLNNGTTILQQLTFHHNQTIGVKAGGYGGAIGNTGVLTISHSFLSNNIAGYGGSIINGGRLVVDSSTFVNNIASNGGWAGGQGGAIFNTALLTVTNSTFSGNVAEVGLGTPSGGAIDNEGAMWIFSSTFSDNRSDRTYYNSQAGGGIANRGIVHLYNSIVANSIDGPDCTGIPTTNINNLIEDGTCESAFYGDPSLGTLADHGGGTLTYDLVHGSAAIDAGDSRFCPATDQRGAVRPIDGDSNGSALCDIGAYEASLGPPITATVPPLPTRTPTGTPTPTRTPAPTATPRPTYTYTSTPTKTATTTVMPTATPTPSPTVTLAPTIEPIFDVRVYVHTPTQTINVGETFTITVTIDNQSTGCIYPVYDLTLTQLGDPVFRFDSPAKVGPPVEAQTVYTLTATTPGTVTLQATAYGERYCGDFWQWTYVNGTTGPLNIIAPLTATATDSATMTPTLTETVTPIGTPTPTPTTQPPLTSTPTITATATPPTIARLGDGNGDQVIDRADISACVQEIFDGDGVFWQDAPTNGYPGTVGCDANEDTFIDAGDIVCTILLMFQGPGACQTSAGQMNSQTAAPQLTLGSNTTASAGQPFLLPVRLTTNGHAVAAAAFVLHFDPNRFRLDPTDNNGDQLADAVTFTLPPLASAPLLTMTQTADTLSVFLTDVAATPAAFSDGPLVTITLTVNPINSTPVMSEFSFTGFTPPSLGSQRGQSLPVQLIGSTVQIVPAAQQLYLPLVQVP